MTEIDYMNEAMLRDMSVRLSNEKIISLSEALTIIYNSKIYKCLNNPKTGLYYQSPNYVYWHLEQELNNQAKNSN